MKTILTKKLFILLFCLATAPSVLFSSEKEYSEKSDLVKAIEDDNVDGVKKIVGLDRSILDGLFEEGGCTSLLYAVRKDSLNVAKLLLSEYGVSVNETDYKERTPLMSSVTTNFIKMAELLIEKRADVNASDDYGATALGRAKKSSGGFNSELVKLLKLHGATESKIELDIATESEDGQ